MVFYILTMDVYTVIWYIDPERLRVLEVSSVAERRAGDQRSGIRVAQQPVGARF